MSFFNRIANLFGPKQENRTIDTDGLVLKKDIKVSELKIQFNERFGSVLRVYSGRSQVSNDITLSEAGLTNEGVFNCRGNMLVGNFINKMMEDYGLKVKVFTCDEWVAVLDGLTLSASGIIKKNAVKADMEAMLSGDDAKPEGVTPVSEAKIGVFAVIKNSDGSYSVTIDGMYCANSKSAMRQIADALEFKYEAEWTTRQFGAKLSDYMNKCASEMQMAPVSASTVEKESVKAEKEAEAEKSAIEAHAELERIKAEAEAAKKAAEAEVKRLQEEAEKAKAEAAKAVAEAEAAAKKDWDEAEKPGVIPGCDNEGALPGYFTINDNGDKICFSRGLLQFNPAKYEFRFAENQYDFISSKDNEKIAPNYDGWIDEFGWGTSGYMGCHPTENSKNWDEYGPKGGGLVDSGANYDWGVYNPIVNGGNKENLWRTPSKEEWLYLFLRRPNAEKLRTYCEVNGVKGLMLMPDNFYNNRIRIHIDCTQNIGCITNKYGIKEWEQLELLGVVFLPARQGDEIKLHTKIWSSSGLITEIKCATALAFRGLGLASATKDCHLGVRLIKDIK